MHCTRNPVRRCRSPLALFCGWLLAAGSAWGAADPLTVIPDSALGVAVIQDLTDTSTRLQKLTDKMQLPVPELLPMAQLYTGAQQGVDLHGNVAAAMFSGEGDVASWSSRIAVFVPVTDYKAFVAQLQPTDAGAEITEVTVFGEKFLVTSKGEFAVLSAPDAKGLLERIKKDEKSVAATVEPLRPWLARQQAALIVTPEGKKQLLEAARGLIDAVQQGAEQAEAAGTDDDQKEADPKKEDEPAPANAGLESIRDAMGSVKELLVAADKQITQLAVGIRIDDSTALCLSARLLFTSEGELSKWATDVKVPPQGLLAGLPPGKFTLAYGGTTVQFHSALAGLFERMMQTGLSQFGLTEEARKKLTDIMVRHQLNQTSSGMLLGQLRPGDKLLSTSMSIERVKDAAEHVKLTREMFDLFSQLRAPGGDPAKPLYSVSDIKVGELPALELVTDLQAAFAAGAKGGPPEVAEMFRSMFAKLFGGDGEMRAYMAIADDHTCVTAYSKELLQRGVDHVRSGKPGLETDATIAKTGALLPEGSQWTAYISPQGVIQWVDALVKQLPPELNFRIPPFPVSDPIGAAARVKPDGLDAELVLPDTVVAGIGQYVGLIQQMMQGGGQLP